MTASFKAVRFWSPRQHCCGHVQKKENRVSKPATESRKHDHQRNKGKSHTHDASTHHHDSKIMQVRKPTFRLEDINTFTALKTARSGNQQCSRAPFRSRRNTIAVLIKTNCREHFPSRSFVFLLRCHMKIPKSLSWDTASSWLDLPGVWIPGASPTCVLRCIALSVSNHSTLALSSSSSSPRLFVSSMVAPIILEIFRLSLELIGPRWFTLNHQFSPSHLHFPPPSSLPDDDSVIRLLSLCLPPFAFKLFHSSSLAFDSLLQRLKSHSDHILPLDSPIFHFSSSFFCTFS